MERQKKKKIYIAIFLLAVAVAIVVLSIVYAKYISNKKYKENQVKAENFYFTSDLIGDDEGIEKTIDVYGSTAIPFSVHNFLDTKRVNANDIQYEVSYTQSWTDADSTPDIEMNYKNDSNADVTVGAGTTVQRTMSAGSAVEHSYVIHINNVDAYGEGEENDKITVTIRSLRSDEGEGYVKTMTLTFVLHKDKYDLMYYVEDGPIYTRLVVMSNVDIPAGQILIDWSLLNQSGNVFQVDTTSQYLLEEDADGVHALDKNKPGEYLSQCHIMQEIRSMESFALFFYKVPKDGITCVGGSKQDPKGAQVIEGEEYKYKIVLEKGE